MSAFIVAIDGPSGVGKGTVARALAERLGFRHVDTGAMYRAVAWKALQERVSFSDESAVTSLAERSDIALQGSYVTIDGRDVTRAIRTPEVDAAAAAVARLPGLRRVLVTRQRGLGATGRVVVEGRDIGTVVFPEADVKIYLDAAPAERARRRAHDPAHAGGQAVEVASALEARDEIDRTRTASPLTVAPDATRIDTTYLGVDEVVDRVCAMVEERLRDRR